MAEAKLPPPSLQAIEALYATGYGLFRQGRLADAESVFRAMVYMSPQDERAWLALGVCYEAQEHLDMALQIYASANRWLGSAPRCEIARARILRAYGRPHEARRALAQASRSPLAAQDRELRAIIADEWVRR
jgi:tetratricopeptide (TPR) repeat protein